MSAIFERSKSEIIHFANWQEWHQASSLAKAFSIGAREAEAVSNLRTKIEEGIVEKLCSSVRQRGMSRFISHEAIAKGVFNTGWTSGLLGCEAWRDEFTNLRDGKLASWFLITCGYICYLEVLK